MPDRAQILAGLTQAANEGFFLAIAWHLLFAAAVVALFAGWRPSRQRAGAWLAVPFGSVSASAWMVGNPFNGSVFAALAIGLVALAMMRGDREPVSTGTRWSRLVGAGLLAFGWFYPHFLIDRPPLAYLMAAPLGLIPCPTLSAVIGLTLIGNGLDNRAWSWTLAGAGTFYALFGVARLGVWLDAPLLFGALSLARVARGLPRFESERPAASSRT